MNDFISINHIDDLKTQEKLFKIAHKMDFYNNHIPTEYDLNNIPSGEDVDMKTYINNLLMILTNYSGRNILYNYLGIVREMLITIKEAFDVNNYDKKYKNLKKLLKQIIILLNIYIHYKDKRYISSVNEHFDDTINKTTSKELYDTIISRLQKISRNSEHTNNKILKAFTIYNNISRRNITEKEYKKCIRFINKNVPDKYFIEISNKIDYPRTLNNYLNNMEDYEIKKETKEEQLTVDEKELYNELQEDKTTIEHYNKSIKSTLKPYYITFHYAEISEDDTVINRDDIKFLERQTYYSGHTDEESIKEDISREIEKNDLGGLLTRYDFAIRPAKEEYHDNPNKDCLKVALKCYDIDFDGSFKEMLNNDEIINNIRFDNVYGNFMFGNIRSKNKILLYNSHAVAIKTNYKRNVKGDTNITVSANKFNDILNNVYKNNIPLRCFNNKVNKGSFEIFQSNSDFNDYNNVIEGEWIKYNYSLDKNIYDYKNIYNPTREEYNEYYKLMVENDEEEDTMEINKYSLNNLIIETEVNEDLREARKEVSNLMDWFNKYLFELCKVIDVESKTNSKGKLLKEPFNDETILNNMYKFICPVFPYDYRRRCYCTTYNRGDEYYSKTFKAIDMSTAYLTAFKSMNKIFCISNIPLCKITESPDNYIIYVKSNILYNGFYWGRYIKIILKCDPKATFEYYKIYKAYPIDTSEITLNYYKIVIGMLISGETSYNYKDAINNINIKEIRNNYDYRGLLHINIMIRRNHIILKEVAKQIQEYNNIPKGYVVDSILYDVDANITDISYEFKKPCEIRKFNDVNISSNSLLNYHFGVAGSGKTTELITVYRDNEAVIINNYNMLSMYYNNNMNAVLWDVFISEFKPIFATKLYVDEIFTFQNSSIELLFYLSGYNDIELSLFGDYNQLKAISTDYFIDSFNLLPYVEHKYKYKNYRNNFEYNGVDSWIMDFSYTNDLIKKRERLFNKLIESGHVKISNKGKTIRYYKADAEQNEKIYKGKYYMLGNYKVRSKKDKIPPFIKKMFQSDVLYTIEEIKEIAEGKFNIVFKYFVNNNCVSFYNTQGQTLKHINIINDKTKEAIIKDGRMFYVFVSRLKGDIKESII